MYRMLEKYLTKKFVYRFVHHGKISHVINDATEALNAAWEVFQVRSTLHHDMSYASQTAAASVC